MMQSFQQHMTSRKWHSTRLTWALVQRQFGRDRVCAPNVMQHEALAVVKGHAHVPLLPGDAAAVDRERWALGLHHMQRLQACASMRQRQKMVLSQSSSCISDKTWIECHAYGGS